MCWRPLAIVSRWNGCFWFCFNPLVPISPFSHTHFCQRSGQRLKWTEEQELPRLTPAKERGGKNKSQQTKFTTTQTVTNVRSALHQWPIGEINFFGKDLPFEKANPATSIHRAGVCTSRVGERGVPQKNPLWVYTTRSTSILVTDNNIKQQQQNVTPTARTQFHNSIDAVQL